MKLTVHIDGGSRGNPGPAGAGVVARIEGTAPLLEAGYFLGRMTNNMAEYNALLRALDFAHRVGANELAIFSDSELLVRQITGRYRVRDAKLKRLYAAAVEKLGRIERWKIRHIYREANQRADELANLAMDAGQDVIAVERTPRAGEPRSAKTVVIARCLRPGNHDVCRAVCRHASKFVFEHAVPPGICLNVAAALLGAVDEVAATGADAEVTCPRFGCGARFKVARARMERSDGH